MVFNLRLCILLFVIGTQLLSTVFAASPSLVSIYTDLNVTSPSSSTSTVLILVGSVYDNGEINQVANTYPGLNSSVSVQTFGKNVILVGCGPCNANVSALLTVTGNFDKALISSSSGLSTSYNGLTLTNSSGAPLAYIVMGNYATPIERQAALSIQVAIEQVQNPPTTTTSISTTSIQTTSVATTLTSSIATTSVATTLSSSIATTLSTTIQATTTVPQSAQQTDPISALINAILNFLKSL